MIIEPLNLSHQTVIENKFRELNLSLSEYSFANLYLFRQLHHYQVILEQEDVFIQGATRDQIPFLMLTSHPTKIPPLLLQSMLAQAQVLYPVPESWLPFLGKFSLQTSFKEADSDYLFATSKLAYFPGRNLSKKRNLVKQLFNVYDIKKEPLAEHLSEAQHILDAWQEERASTFGETDYLSCQEALQNFETLHLHGQIIYADQQPVGFTIGEWISNDCYVLHFSKGLHVIKGLNQYLYEAAAQDVEGTCDWMNLEQDLGIPALRTAKHSYNPDKLLVKWRVQLQFD